MFDPNQMQFSKNQIIGLKAGLNQIAQLRWDWEVSVPGLPAGACWMVPATVRKSNARKSIDKQKGRYLVCNRIARSVVDDQRGNGSEVGFP